MQSLPGKRYANGQINVSFRKLGDLELLSNSSAAIHEGVIVLTSMSYYSIWEVVEWWPYDGQAERRKHATADGAIQTEKINFICNL